MRNTVRHLVALSLLTACQPEATDTGSDTGPQFQDSPPTVLGGDRPATMVRPTAYTPEQEWPLIVLLHGYGANANLQDSFVFGLGERVDRDGFLLLKPEGTEDAQGNQFWNATTECCNFYGSDVDDVAYIAGIIEEAKTLYPISQVSIVGHSNGAYMGYRMACDRPDLFTRLVALAGVTVNNEALCTGTEPVSVAHIHGTADSTILYDSSATHAGAEQTIERWSAKAGCAEPPARLDDRDYLTSVLGDETRVDRWSGCTEGIEIELWSGFGGDHAYLAHTPRFEDDVTAFALGNPIE